MEAGSGTTDPNSESGSSSNSFTAHMAAGRAAVRDGLTLESPKDENGNTRRRGGKGKRVRRALKQSKNKGFDEHAWYREMEARFDSPSGTDTDEISAFDTLVPPMDHLDLQSDKDQEKWQRAHVDREREAIKAFADSPSLIRELEDGYFIPHGTLDLYPRLKVACINKALEKKKLHENRETTKPTADSDGNLEKISSQNQEVAKAHCEAGEIQASKNPYSLSGVTKQVVTDGDTFLSVPPIHGKLKTNSKNDGKKEDYSPTVWSIIRDMEEKVARRKGEVGPAVAVMRQAMERYKHHMIMKTIDRLEQQATQGYRRNAPPLSDRAIADLLKKAKPESPKSQETIKRAENGKRCPPDTKSDSARRIIPPSPSQVAELDLDRITRVQLATLRLQRALDECPYK